ncbi:unnamed protein product [Acanthosepion pharaonis]|uniref:Uncharacterized protein n=1 Tax=Acanthosepion pharaonis TaxID=158019 RepID=A0A812C8Q6_ACAPH|nr:unnamed protein product [Sepia pharaonis]
MHETGRVGPAPPVPRNTPQLNDSYNPATTTPQIFALKCSNTALVIRQQQKLWSPAVTFIPANTNQFAYAQVLSSPILATRSHFHKSNVALADAGRFVAASLNCLDFFHRLSEGASNYQHQLGSAESNHQARNRLIHTGGAPPIGEPRRCPLPYRPSCFPDQANANALCCASDGFWPFCLSIDRLDVSWPRNTPLMPLSEPDPPPRLNFYPLFSFFFSPVLLMGARLRTKSTWVMSIPVICLFYLPPFSLVMAIPSPE